MLYIRLCCIYDKTDLHKDRHIITYQNIEKYT